MSNVVLKIWQRFEFSDAQGKNQPLGITLYDKPLTIEGSAADIHRQDHTVSAAGIVKLFDVSEDLASFTAALVVANQHGLVQYVNHDGANFFTLPTVADLIQPLFGDAGQHGGSVGAFDGTADAIEVIYWKNTSSTAAVVTILAIK